MRQDGEKEYEPGSIRSSVASLRRYLKEYDYGDTTKMPEFSEVKDVVTMVCKSLEAQGKGGLPNKSQPITNSKSS